MRGMHIKYTSQDGRPRSCLDQKGPKSESWEEGEIVVTIKPRTRVV